mgnify:CR=1 FL=1
MTEEKKSERLNLILTPEEMTKLQDLADENTGKNKSFMIRLLIERAWEQPRKFGFHDPKADALAVA